MHNPILSIFEALAVSGFPNKEDLRIEVLGCIKSFISYFDDVVNEQIYYSATAKDKQDICIMKAHDERRRKAHDLCIASCVRLNSICDEMNIDKICDFDVEDRKQVAEFAGLIACDLYFTNIKCGESLTNWLNNSPLKKEGQP